MRQRFLVLGSVLGPSPSQLAIPQSAKFAAAFSLKASTLTGSAPSSTVAKAAAASGVVAKQHHRCCWRDQEKQERLRVWPGLGFKKSISACPLAGASSSSLRATSAAEDMDSDKGPGTLAPSGFRSDPVGTVAEDVQALRIDDERPAPPRYRTELYPPIEPYKMGFLKVSDIHTLYWEESGNPAGVPVLFLHGGPGSGTSPSNRRFFDPAFYRIVLFDQRGSGKSTPHACLEENTTWHLVADVERVREHLGIDKWQVFGGSWGSTLSLAYAETHPERVTALILRGIFMVRKKELDWFYQSGGEVIYPDAWEAYKGAIPKEEHGDIIAAYNRRLMNDSQPDVQTAAARAWTAWEMATSYLLQNAESLKRTENDMFALAFARIENHYFFNRGFFSSDSHLLDGVPKIRHIPAVIVQGRYDIVCPMMSAWDLHKAWPEAELKIVQDAGHSCNEPGIGAELVAANEKFKTLYTVTKP